MGAHIVDGEFQSDKYPDCPRGKVPLSVKDPMAQDLLWEYAQRRRAVDAEFAEDLETCLRTEGYEPATQRADAKRVQQVVLDAVHEVQAVSPGHDVWYPRQFAAAVADRVVTELSDELEALTECLVHAGMIHGGEAHELRAGLEGLIADPPSGDIESNHEWCCAIQAVLDDVDARDSLAHIERGPSAAAVLSSEDRGALLALRRLVVATAKSCSQKQEYFVQIALLDRWLGGDVSAPASTVEA